MVYVRNAYSYSCDGVRLKGLLPFTASNHYRAVPEYADVRFELELIEFANGRAVTDDGLVRVQLHTRGIKFSKVLSIVTLYSKYSRALTFQNLCQASKASSTRTQMPPPLTRFWSSTRPRSTGQK